MSASGKFYLSSSGRFRRARRENSLVIEGEGEGNMFEAFNF